MSTSNLITGGAGFIGANLAHRLLSQGERVLILDNAARQSLREPGQQEPETRAAQ